MALEILAYKVFVALFPVLPNAGGHQKPKEAAKLALEGDTGELGEQIGVQLGFGGAVPADGVVGGTDTRQSVASPAK